MYQLEREKCVKVRVRNNIEGHWKERILIQILEDNSVLCVSEFDVERFDTGASYTTSRWNYWEEIKEPAYIPFDKNAELEPYIDCWFRYKKKPILMRPIGYDMESGGVLRFDGAWYDREELYTRFEMKVDDKWVPVGKLEEK